MKSELTRRLLANALAVFMATSSLPVCAQETQPPATPASSDSQPAATTPSATTPADATPPSTAPVQPVTPETPAQPQATQPEPKPEPTKTAAHAMQPPASKPHASKAPAAAAKPVTLQGRIEEIVSDPKPQLKLLWKAATPIRDTRLDGKLQGKATTLSSAASLQSFPIDYRGSWTGPLTVYTAAFDPACWQFDPDEAKKESALMRPGVQGTCSVNFYQTNNRIMLQPTQVVFQAQMSAAESSAALQRELGPLAGMLGSGQMANLQVPYMFALHMGNLTDARGVTGNSLKGQLVKNDLRELKPGVLEQVVVNHLSDTNPKTGKQLLSYGESVLRFTRIDSNRLYLQCAVVNYRNDGKFLNKIVLYGTLNRSSGAGSYPGTGLPSSLPGMPAGGSGDMGAAMQQLQQLFQQMNR